jgi:hypothetical protein
MPSKDQPQYPQMNAAEIRDFLDTPSDPNADEVAPDTHGWTDAHARVFAAADKRHRAVRDDATWGFERAGEDVRGVVEFLDDQYPGEEWSAEEFARIGTGDFSGTGRLADVVTAYLKWRDSA